MLLLWPFGCVVVGSNFTDNYGGSRGGGVELYESQGHFVNLSRVSIHGEIWCDGDGDGDGDVVAVVMVMGG